MEKQSAVSFLLATSSSIFPVIDPRGAGVGAAVGTTVGGGVGATEVVGDGVGALVVGEGVGAPAVGAVVGAPVAGADVDLLAPSFSSTKSVLVMFNANARTLPTMVVLSLGPSQ